MIMHQAGFFIQASNVGIDPYCINWSTKLNVASSNIKF